MLYILRYDISINFRETVSCIFSANVRFKGEMFGFRGDVITYIQFIDKLYDGKLAKWKQGVFDSRR